jgi:hypothetical protein
LVFSAAVASALQLQHRIAKLERHLESGVRDYTQRANMVAQKVDALRELRCRVQAQATALDFGPDFFLLKLQKNN